MTNESLISHLPHNS